MMWFFVNSSWLWPGRIWCSFRQLSRDAEIDKQNLIYMVWYLQMAVIVDVRSSSLIPTTDPIRVQSQK